MTENDIIKINKLISSDFRVPVDSGSDVAKDEVVNHLWQYQGDERAKAQ